MSPAIETKIWLALQGRIIDLMPDVDKAWPAVGYAPTMGKPFLRVGRVNAQPLSRLINPAAPHERSGTIILSMVTPVSTGSVSPELATTAYLDQAALVGQHFPSGLQLRYADVCVTITQAAHVQAGYADAGWWTVPVTISWRCFA